MRFRRGILALVLAFSTTSVYAYDDVHRCDELAAHPQDPERWAKGVYDADLVPAPATRFCSAAVAEHPDTARFRFQLARAHWVAKRYDDAIPLFLDVAERHEYLIAWTYLALAADTGLGVAPDPDLARQMAERARNAGFEIEPASATQSAAAPAFDPSLFNQPHVIGALYSGDFDRLFVSGIGQTMDYVPLSQELIYVTGLNNSFADRINRIMDRDCALIYKPAVQERLLARISSSVLGDTADLDAVAGKGFELIGRMMKDMAQGDLQGLAAKERNTALLRQMGEQDGERLLVAYGCGSDVVRQIYTNIEALVAGTAPVRRPASASGSDAIAPAQSVRGEQLRQQWDARDRRRQLEQAREGLMQPGNGN